MLRQQSLGTSYFVERGAVILGNNWDDPLLAPVRERVGLPAYDGPPEGRDDFYRAYAGGCGIPALYAVFYYLHRLAALRLDGACDLVLDVDDIARDPMARDQAQRRLAALTGVDVSFSDCHPESYEDLIRGDVAEARFHPVEREMDDLLTEVVSRQDRCGYS